MNATATATPITEQESMGLAVHAGLKASEIAVFEAESLQLESEALSITITDQETYNRMVEAGQRIQSCIKRWANWIQHPYDVIYGSYQRVLELRKSIQAPLDRGKAHAAREIVRFEREQREAEEARNRQLREEQEKQEQERKLNLAAEAEAQGASEEVKQQILSAPSTAPTPKAAPTFEKATGAAVTSSNWGCEIYDVSLLVEYVAKNMKKRPELLNLLEVENLKKSHPALNREAKTHKSALGSIIPGVRGVDNGKAGFRAPRS